MAKRTSRSTPQQFEAMIKYMTSHPHLINGKLSNILSSARRDRMWKELADILNEDIHGPKKTVHQWRRAWIDLKSEVRDKIAEQEAKGKSGCKEEILNPCHKKVAHLLTKVAVELELAGKHARAEARSAFEVKDENCIFLDTDNCTPKPFVVSLISLNKNQDKRNDNSRNVKNEDSINDDNSDLDLAPEPSNKNVNRESNISNLDYSVLSNTSFYNKGDSQVPKKKRHRRGPADDDAHLNNLVLIEKEKTEMLSLIAHALTTTNENEEKRIKVEEARNGLIQERNAIENERNELFKAFLEHIASKDIL